MPEYPVDYLSHGHMFGLGFSLDLLDEGFFNVQRPQLAIRPFYSSTSEDDRQRESGQGSPPGTRRGQAPQRIPPVPY